MSTNQPLVCLASLSPTVDTELVISIDYTNICTTGGYLIHSDPDVPATLGQIQALLHTHFSANSSISLLRGFKLNFSGNSDFHKVYFSVKCDCGTAALISVEVSASKSQSEVSTAIPNLIAQVKSKAKQFNAMTCKMHLQMRSGNLGK
ncbi:hypothetical protein FIM12_03335 [SAR202 cluster bacterium AD-804-J14_MRT_500m]|nr:hypothetical protein [SAR202 cluster bacterium AD-804-J14_MRT_500m]